MTDSIGSVCVKHENNSQFVCACKTCEKEKE